MKSKRNRRFSFDYGVHILAPSEVGAGCGRSERLEDGTHVARASRFEAWGKCELRFCELPAGDAGEADKSGAEKQQ